MQRYFSLSYKGERFFIPIYFSKWNLMDVTDLTTGMFMKSFHKITHLTDKREQSVIYLCYTKKAKKRSFQ